jgi:crotonyl-CoA reductase
VNHGGGVSVGVVGSEAKAAAARRLGCQVVIQREEIGLADHAADPAGDTGERTVEIGKRLGSLIRQQVGEDPHIVFEHTGRLTFAISVFVVRRGGVVVTCGSSTGYQHEFDNRHLWMKLKRIIGSHVANLQEQWECARLIRMGRIMPTLSAVFPLEHVGEATRLVQTSQHAGKIGVLCLAPARGLGVTDAAQRARIGADRLNPLLPRSDIAQRM